MANNNMDTLRANLFDTIEGLKQKKVTVTEANAIAGVANCIIGTIKVEIDARRIAGNKALPSFLLTGEKVVEEDEGEPGDGYSLADLIPSPNHEPVGVTVHRMDYKD